MFGHGKCPTCGESVSRCDLDAIIVGNQVSGPFFHGVSMCCPNAKCHAVLGVSIDPSAFAVDVARQVTRQIQGKKG